MKTSILKIFLILLASAFTSCKTSQLVGPGTSELPAAKKNSLQSSSPQAPVLGSRAVSNLYPAVLSQVAFLGQDQFWTARWKLLEQARFSVRLQTFIFNADEAGFAMAQKLIELKQAGLDVRVVVDPVFNHKPEVQEIYFDMQQAGIPVKGFEVGYGGFINMLGSAANLGDLFQNGNMRHHEKFFIIDAEDPSLAQAIIGGTNVSNEYFRIEYENREYMWQDRDILVKGGAAVQMAQAFEKSSQDLDVTLARQSQSQLAALVQGISNLVKKVKKRPETHRSEIYQRLEEAGLESFQPVFFETQTRLYHSRPRYKEDAIYPRHISLLQNATKSIDIAHSYLVPDPELISALKQAASHGVKVRILTNHKEITDVEQLTTLARTRYAELLQSENITIFEWGGHKTLGNNEGLNHAKYMLADRAHVIVGSFNLDHRSRFLNSEAVLAFSQKDIANQFAEEFDLWVSPRYSLKITKSQAEAFKKITDKDSLLDQVLAKFMAPFL